jgi:hypothetical protein
MGMKPVGLVQGFCVMKWSWYGINSPFRRSNAAYVYGDGMAGYSEYFTCPHTLTCDTGWGQNFEQVWMERAWADGFGTAYRRMVEEAAQLGAHGVIGVVDTCAQLSDMAIMEFHLLGTAVVVEGAAPPPFVWTTYLAGQRLAKLIEAGYMPLAVLAALGSIRVWDVCVTEYLLGGSIRLKGRSDRGAEITQLANAHMAARRVVRGAVRGGLGRHDTLHGVRLDSHEIEVGEGDQEVNCTLRGTRVRRFKDFEPLPPLTATVSLR